MTDASEPIRHRKPEDRPSLSFDLGEVQPVPEETLRRLNGDFANLGDGAADPAPAGTVGFTMFDSRTSEDNSVTVLLSDERIADVPSQSLVRIRSGDGRGYLGTVVAGPFAEPDGLRADSNILVTVVTRGGIFRAPYHGRVQVEILGEERDGALVPPRYRPLPNSPVSVLDDRETAAVLRADGDIQVGQVAGHEAVTIAVPSTRKDVLPRHTAILGTTGGGKSTTVARLVQQAQAAGCAVIVLDVEGEYTFLHQPTVDPTMLAALERRGLAPAGLERMWLCHLVGRDTANPDHPGRAEFCLRFERPSPYTLMELLDLTEAQRLRFLKAYDTAKLLLRELGIFPERGRAEHDQLALDVDDFDRGYPGLELQFLLDVVAAFGLIADKDDGSGFRPRHPVLQANPDPALRRARAAKPDNAISWRALLGKLGGLNRLKVFDRSRDARPLNYKKLLQPGAVTVVDLSDTGSPVVNNLVIADLLRGVQEAQDEAYASFEAAGRRGQAVEPPTRVLIVIEEAHEFLSAGPLCDRSRSPSIRFRDTETITPSLAFRLGTSAPPPHRTTCRPAGRPGSPSSAPRRATSSTRWSATAWSSSAARTRPTT